jgi:hypothetical protein
MLTESRHFGDSQFYASRMPRANLRKKERGRPPPAENAARPRHLREISGGLNCPVETRGENLSGTFDNLARAS